MLKDKFLPISRAAELSHKMIKTVLYVQNRDKIKGNSETGQRQTGQECKCCVAGYVVSTYTKQY